MYIHIGGDVSLPADKILGIFDIEKTSVNKDVNDYLTARIKGRTQKPSTQKNAPETKAVQTLRNNLQALKAETAEIEPLRRKGVKI